MLWRTGEGRQSDASAKAVLSRFGPTRRTLGRGRFRIVSETHSLVGLLKVVFVTITKTSMSSRPCALSTTSCTAAFSTVPARPFASTHHRCWVISPSGDGMLKVASKSRPPSAAPFPFPPIRQIRSFAPMSSRSQYTHSSRSWSRIPSNGISLGSTKNFSCMVWDSLAEVTGLSSDNDRGPRSLGVQSQHLVDRIDYESAWL